ncbi:MAG: PLP-dependent aspartate aminotransferase family protein [Bacteroidota bacterium]
MKKDINDILFHEGEDRENYFQAISPPIIQSSNFAFPSLPELREMLANEMDHYVYGRGNNPTVDILRKKMAALAGAEDALLFGSGSAAVAAAVLSQVNAGDHIICVDKPYSWTSSLLNKWLTRFQVKTTFVDAKKIENIEAAIQDNTKLLILESPNSLTFELQDLEACADLAKANNIITCIDNSYATPLFQRPLELGIDISVHAITKYPNGHSDVMAGAICASKEIIRQIFQHEYMMLGAMLSPHDAALVIRGLRTLPLRMQRSHESAMKIVEHLAKHPKVKEVLYPFHPSFSQYELAKQQMTGAGGLFSVHLDLDTLEQADAVFHRFKRFKMAASWGGHESLVLPSAAFYNIEGREDSPIPFTLFRFYIGLEDVAYLVEDIEQALAVL